MKKLFLTVVTLLSLSLASHADQALGNTCTEGLPPFAPDGQTRLHMVADGTPTGTLFGGSGSRYVRWLDNPAQGFLFDRITRQSWYSTKSK